MRVMRRCATRIDVRRIPESGTRFPEQRNADGQLMEQLLPDAGLVVFPGAGHFAYADDPGRFCRVLTSFMQSTA